jgi:hypothetical protein
MPVILATWEAENRRIVVPGWTGQKSFGDLISMEKKLGIVAHACHPSYPAWAKKRDPSSKITRAKRAGNVVQVVERLPSKHKAMSSNPSTTKKRKK